MRNISCLLYTSGGHHRNKCFLAHRLQRVVGAALFAEGRDRFFAERFAAQRARAVRWVHQAFVRQPEQLGVQGIEKHPAEIGSGPAKRGAQIGPAHVPDEQSVPGQYGLRLRGAFVQIENEDGDRLRCCLLYTSRCV